MSMTEHDKAIDSLPKITYIRPSGTTIDLRDTPNLAKYAAEHGFKTAEQIEAEKVAAQLEAEKAVAQ